VYSVDLNDYGAITTLSFSEGMFVCVCVFVCVCMYVCMYVYMYISIYVYMFVCV
jgi:hypothetical protein